MPTAIAADNGESCNVDGGSLNVCRPPEERFTNFVV
jgi:hypothetical protein